METAQESANNIKEVYKETGKALIALRKAFDKLITEHPELKSKIKYHS